MQSRIQFPQQVLRQLVYSHGLVDRKGDFSSLRQWWDHGKTEIKLLCQQHTLNVTRDITRSMKDLETDIVELERLSESITNQGYFEILKVKKLALADLLDAKVQGALVRSRYQASTEMDAPSSFFFGLEKRSGQRRNVTWKRDGFKYLGVFLGKEHVVKKNWENVTEKFEGKLSKCPKADSLYWLLREPLIYGAKLDISSSVTPGLTVALLKTKTVCLQQLVDAVGPALNDTQALGSLLGLHSVRVAGRLLELWRQQLTGRERSLLMDYGNKKARPDPADPFPDIFLSPGLGQLTGPLLAHTHPGKLTMNKADKRTWYFNCVKSIHKAGLCNRPPTVWSNKLGADPHAILSEAKEDLSSIAPLRYAKSFVVHKHYASNFEDVLSF
ncbi:Transposon TX1 uncharacterized protein [Merluccius polli]|uniref:Transposon TX1 uncharacterized protein n=1 Tax=Merluccius polli TaxID=89951 RepID=A0AA47M1U0_MERPO|nr:Transposon TX1 uncharacterized protein [Merluccius polli]